MTLPRISLLALACVAFSTSLLADTVVLKDGTKIEGKITNESDTQITIETKSGGVIDEQTVKKEDVQTVSKASADETAFTALRAIKLGANSLPGATQYDNYVSALKGFVSQFPESKHKAEVEKLAADFEAEQKRVADGEVKLDGKWLSKTEVQRERYQVDAMVASNYMKEQAARGDAIGAMNTFDIIKKKYPGSRGYVEAIDSAKRLLPALKQQADARLARLPAETAEREKSVAGAAGLNKVQLQGELDREKKVNETALAQAKRQGLKWPPFIARSEDSMKEISNLAGEGASELASVDVAKARQSIQLTAEARAALDKKDLAAAEAKTREARDAWAENETVARLDTEIGNAKAASDSSKAEAAAAEEAKAEPKAEEKPAETASETTSESSEAAPASETAAAEEEGNPLFKIILIAILAIVAFVGFNAYRKVKKKAGEVIE